MFWNFLERTKIAGAVQYCTAKKLTKQCPYEKVTKYLVLTSDKVEHLHPMLYVFMVLIFWGTRVEGF